MNTPEEMIEVCEAIRDRKMVECEMSFNGDWQDCFNDGSLRPHFNLHRYRLKPEPPRPRILWLKKSKLQGPYSLKEVWPSKPEVTSIHPDYYGDYESEYIKFIEEL